MKNLNNSSHLCQESKIIKDVFHRKLSFNLTFLHKIATKMKNCAALGQQKRTWLQKQWAVFVHFPDRSSRKFRMEFMQWLGMQRTERLAPIGIIGTRQGPSGFSHLHLSVLWDDKARVFPTNGMQSTQKKTPNNLPQKSPTNLKTAKKLQKNV